MWISVGAYIYVYVYLYIHTHVNMCKCIGGNFAWGLKRSSLGQGSFWISHFWLPSMWCVTGFQLGLCVTSSNSKQ